MQKNNLNIAFFGTDKFSVKILDALKDAGLLPSLVVTMPDKPKGRKLLLTPPEAKIWAEENEIATIQPDKLDSNFLETINELKPWDFFIVASYGKIIGEEIINIPKYKTLNVHPSLLPKFRGPSPIESQILADEKNIGVTIIELDKEMDHGPIVAKKEIILSEWPQKDEVENMLATSGAEILIDSIRKIVEGKAKFSPQDHSKATFTKMIEKKDAQINLSDDEYSNYRKIIAYSDWPNAYFFTERKGKSIRVIIKKASWINNKLEIEKVLPENGREISYQDFIKGL
ncbi:methionyl-tRNA formyltransferase [Candidatus Nomurabacteria bacterium]|nr:methionyl-tRNA formyltransferase [Candidatus Nomurabacteria bacterium]